MSRSKMTLSLLICDRSLKRRKNEAKKQAAEERRIFNRQDLLAIKVQRVGPK